MRRMIDHKRKCLFVHIPKTGGNSMNAVFGQDWSPHRDLEAYAALEGIETVRSYFKFALVRNPWARLFSDYNYQKRKSRGVKLHVHDAHGRVRKFPDWVDAVVDDPHRYDPSDWGGKPSPGIHRWSPQVDWISLDGRPTLDAFLKIEEAVEGFPALAAKLGLPQGVRLPKRNWRFHFPYRWHYSKKLAEKVGELYERDVTEFGYSF